MPESAVVKLWPRLILAVAVLTSYWTYRALHDWRHAVALVLLPLGMVSLDSKTPVVGEIGFDKLSRAFAKHRWLRDWAGAIALLFVGLACGFYIGSLVLTNAANYHRGAVVFYSGVVIVYGILLVLSLVVASLRVGAETRVSTFWRRAGWTASAIGAVWLFVDWLTG